VTRVLLYTHPACLLHDNGPGHPERPDRVPAALHGVRESGLDVIDKEAPSIDRRLLYPIHEPSYVQMIEAACMDGGTMLDPDTVVVTGSWEASLRAAGAGIDAVDALLRDEGDMAYLAIRPPGHHAGAHAARGFCIFNNIAITAEAITARGETVAILDWDVHHGDGSEETFYGRSDVLYLSIHQFPFYPGSGWFDEVGTGAGAGFTVNVPVPAYSAGDVLAAATDEIFEPVLTEFDPDWILVSAGFDAHTDDPLAELRFESSDFGWVSERLLSGHRGRVIVFLEGGYDLPAIQTASAATVRGIAGMGFDRPTGSSPGASWTMLRMAREEAALYWNGVQGT
jgi:acetoin utilization deacetylase AcuC-like enzyme